MDWLGEPSWKLLGGLLLLAILLGLIWKTRPGKATLLGFLGALFLFVLVIAFGFLIETDGEKIRNQLQGMASAANKRNWGSLEKGFSDTFTTHGGHNKAWVISHLRNLEATFGPRRVVLRQIAIENQSDPSLKVARFTMRLDGGGGDMQLIEVEAWMRKIQGQWLVEKVKVFRPMSGNSSPLPI